MKKNKILLVGALTALTGCAPQHTLTKEAFADIMKEYYDKVEDILTQSEEITSSPVLDDYLMDRLESHTDKNFNVTYSGTLHKDHVVIKDGNNLIAGMMIIYDVKFANADNPTEVYEALIMTIEDKGKGAVIAAELI